MIEDAGPDSFLDWSKAKQGDVVELDRLGYWTGEVPELEYVGTPIGVALVSQTCDLVRVSPGDRVLVAPVLTLDKAELSQIRKGRSPLKVLVGTTGDKAIDLAMVTSVPRNLLSRSKVLDRTVDEQSGAEAGRLASRIGRALSRFPFPDEVVSALSKLRRKVSDSYQKQTDFSAVLHHIEEFRISCNHWNRPHRRLTIYAIVPSDYLPPDDMKTEEWKWSTENVVGAKQGMRPQDLTIETLSNLILQNRVADNDSALIELWHWWKETLADGWLQYCDHEVDSIELEVVSTLEFTYEDYSNSESLDFSTLTVAAG